MFGIVRPCRHRLSGPLFGEWMGHLCGLCLTLRDVHGQWARLVTNHDGALVSVLTEAQAPAMAPRRMAGPCALRRMRTADVLDSSGAGARLAAAVSLILAAGKIRDHVADSDGALARPLLAAAAGRAAERWQAAGTRTAAAIGFDPTMLTDAIARQAALERAGGLNLAEVTEPTETAVGAAFSHTATLAARPGNARLLTRVGQRFGRLAHLIDAVEDLPADRAAGAYNPLLATRTTVAKAHERCEEAVSGLRLDLAKLDLERPALARALLGDEVAAAVRRTFRPILRGTAEGSCRRPLLALATADGMPPDQPEQLGPYNPIAEPGDLPPRPGLRRRRSCDCCDCADCCECPDCCDACDCCDCAGC